MGILAAISSRIEAKKDQLIPKSGWGSRKLWIFAGMAMTLVWLGRGNLTAILDSLIWLTGVYLVTQVIQDVGESFSTAWVTREKLRCESQVKVETLRREPYISAAPVKE